MSTGADESVSSRRAGNAPVGAPCPPDETAARFSPDRRQSGAVNPVSIAYAADERDDSPENLQMPMTRTPMQAPNDIPNVNTSMAHSPLWTPPERAVA